MEENDFITYPLLYYIIIQELYQSSSNVMHREAVTNVLSEKEGKESLGRGPVQPGSDKCGVHRVCSTNEIA